MKRIKRYWFYIQGLVRYKRIPDKTYRSIVSKKEFAVMYARYRLHRYDPKPIKYQPDNKWDIDYWRTMYDTYPIDCRCVVRIEE